MYKISEFSKMVGLPQSKIRFYEKYGLLRVHKDKNGYRYFTHHDAFRVNAFRVLLRYDFTVEQAIQMLDEKQSGEVFISTLENRRQELETQIEIMNNRLSKLNRVISLLRDGYEDKFELTECEDFIYIFASNGTDFSMSIDNAEIIEQFVELLSITSYARIIKKEQLLQEKALINPSYACVVPVSKESYLDKYDKSKVNVLKLGKCIRFYRNKTREESAKIESFKELFNFMEKNNYKINGDVLLLPTFLNLDGKGSDIEVLYVPIE